ncbi:MAG: hypothetical protein LKJ69_02785 [Lactobacillus sp.]|jgi:uncharacterized protein YukE|nr:hypothetical protein [Lactobacillus sp.]MCI2032305.1 hypothetical protein [Lactobacillus sp.]
MKLEVKLHQQQQLQADYERIEAHLRKQTKELEEVSAQLAANDRMLVAGLQECWQGPAAEQFIDDQRRATRQFLQQADECSLALEQERRAKQQDFEAAWEAISHQEVD